MKKIRWIRASLLVIAIVLCVSCGVWFLESPQYALLKISKDISTTGVQGLNSHLTGEAEKTVNYIIAFSENKFVNSVLFQVGSNNNMETLRLELNKVSWKIDDIKTTDKRADVDLRYEYEDKLSGNLNIEMVFCDHDWKISKIHFPQNNYSDF